ncbi:MAG TPA: cytochrome c [Flavobacteriales bacterium]|nr:cytochrome c [Flavobacteriales bacterium]HIN39916.1 cytochrome c [Flavobacteriales bacterium]
MECKKTEWLLSLLCSGLVLSYCASEPEEVIEEVDPMTNIGIGPIKSIVLGEIDMDLVEKGKKFYNETCTACHKIDVKIIGPPQAGILKRRTPEWVMNLILNPAEMLKKDPTARKLLKEYNNVQMTDQGVTQEEARSILEYFRTI